MRAHCATLSPDGASISHAAVRRAFVAGRTPLGRRRERRTPYRVLCRLITLTTQERPVALIGETVNVSAGGLGVRVARPLRTGLHVRAIIPRPQGEPAVYQGVVVYCRRVLATAYELGVEFTEPRDSGFRPAGNAPEDVGF